MNRYRRRLMQSLSPEERMARFLALQRSCMRQLRANPAGWNAFMRRNIRMRAV